MIVRIPRVLIYVVTISLLASLASMPPSATAQEPATPAATRQAQSDSGCADFVKAALAATTAACADTGNNQACYGSVAIKAEAQPSAGDFAFDAPGKIVDVSAIKSLQLSALDAQEKTWGVALMRLRANLPGTVVGQYVTMLVFGDVQLENAVPPPTATLTMTVATNTDVRSKPINGAVVGKLAAKDSVLLTGRLKDSTWLRVQVTSKDGKVTIMGWIASKTLNSTSDFETLDVVDPADPLYGPMQAFYFQTGVGAQSCQAAPPNGILIQTPKGSPKVTMMINNAKVNIGSTVFMDSSDDMTLSTFDGAITVEASGKQVNVPTGLQVALPLGNDHKVSGPPETPRAIKYQDYSTLPLAFLPVPIAPTNPPQPNTQTTPRPGGQTASFICPSGTPIRTVIPSITANGQTFPGRTIVAPCTCNTGTHTISVTVANGATASQEICN